MSGLHHAIIGAIVPLLVRKATPWIGKMLKLRAMDRRTRKRVNAQRYPWYYGSVYTLLLLTIIGAGLFILLFFMIVAPSLFPERGFALLTLLGMLAMIGVWFAVGALADTCLWHLSSDRFRDYIRFRLIRENFGYDIEQQIISLWKITAAYWLIISPVALFILL